MKQHLEFVKEEPVFGFFLIQVVKAIKAAYKVGPTVFASNQLNTPACSFFIQTMSIERHMDKQADETTRVANKALRTCLSII